MKSPFLYHSLALFIGAAASFALVSQFHTPSPEFSSDADVPSRSQASEPGSLKQATAAVYSDSESSRPNPPSEEAPLIGDIVKNFHDRVAYAQSFPSMRRQRWEMERLFADMTPENAADVMAIVMEDPEYRVSTVLGDLFFAKWGEIDGASALAAAQTLGNNEKYSATKAVFNTWARSDLSSAWAAAQNFLDSPDRQSANVARGVLKEVAVQAPDTLIAMLNTLDAPHINITIRDKLIEAAIESQGQAKLLRSLDQLEDPENRNRITRDLFGKWSQMDPDVAIEKLAAITEPSQAEAALNGYVRGWSQTSPSGALDYALDNQGDKNVEQITTGLINQAILSSTQQETEALIDRIEQAGLLKKYGERMSRVISIKDPELGSKLKARLQQSE